MHKIGDDTSTAVPATGEWTEGGAGGTPPATILKAPWLNSVQRELLNLLTEAVITPSGADDTQVMAAITKILKVANDFRVTQSTTANMSVRVRSGSIFSITSLTEIAEQSVAFVAPTTNPRIDRIVLSALTGVVLLIVGVQSASPVAPAIPAGSVPLARILLQTTSSVITNNMITDERASAAAQKPFRGVLARAVAAQNLVGSSTVNIMTFGGEDYDTEGAHSTVTDNWRINVPAGVTKAQFFGGVEAFVADGDSVNLLLVRNGATGNVNPGAGVSGKGTSYGPDLYTFSSAIMDVTPGDNFQLWFHYSGVTGISTNPQGTYLSMIPIA